MDPSSDQLPPAGNSDTAPTQPPAINLPQPTAASAPAPNPPVAAAPPASQNPLQTAAIPTTQPVTSPMLNDTDEVEKTWVDRARKIVTQTQGDPYQQSQQLTALKAEYMKQRYNKIIKVGQ